MKYIKHIIIEDTDIELSVGVVGEPIDSDLPTIEIDMNAEPKVLELIIEMDPNSTIH